MLVKRACCPNMHMCQTRTATSFFPFGFLLSTFAVRMYIFKKLALLVHRNDSEAVPYAHMRRFRRQHRLAQKKLCGSAVTRSSWPDQPQIILIKTNIGLASLRFYAPSSWDLALRAIPHSLFSLSLFQVHAL